MEVVKLTSENFKKEVLESNKKTIVDFYADWCGPCKMQAPIIEEIAKEREDIKVGKLNVDENADIASQYDVMSIPTLLVIENGKVLKQFVGLTSKEEILNV